MSQSNDTNGGRKSEPHWDQLSIDTPELVGIDMPVAGIGSRFVALMVDYLIWLAVLILVVIFIAVVDPSLTRFSRIGQKWATAIFILIPFFFLWGYFTLFEAFWNGRTPGKRVAKIRVIQVSGRGIGLFESMTRNLVRFVDQFPGIYAVGAVCVFLSRRHQRLGDMAAGTLVVHERERLDGSTSIASNRTFTEGLFARQTGAETASRRPVEFFPISAGELQRLDTHDLEILEAFFARRLDFSIETRKALAERIARGIASKAELNIPTDLPVETFLEEVARSLRDSTRMR